MEYELLFLFCVNDVERALILKFDADEKLQKRNKDEK